ncbi:hypothetical protein [Streptomyces hydrogenans]|uniref:hypothetical protein n=1 Tax=Streptomyces hydrogenans TaxID=1873719 RepID=UPI0036E82753
MSLLTLTTAITGNQDPDYYAGRADAHDEHTAGTTLPVLEHRAQLIADEHFSFPYAAGYWARVLEIRHEHAATITAQTHLAHTGAAA